MFVPRPIHVPSLLHVRVANILQAAVYEWNDEYGDVGPRFEELEKQLFGAKNHVRAGINFEGIQELEVIQEGNLRMSPVRRFEDAALHPVMLENVKLAGYTVPTPIQQYCVPAVAKGHDIVACAQTGKLIFLVSRFHSYPPHPCLSVTNF